MLKRILGLLGWLGVALVFAAVALRFTRPDLGWHQPLAMAGLVCTLLYVLSQWREVVRSFSGREARYGTLAAPASSSCSASSSPSTTWPRATTSGGTSPPRSSSRCRTRRARILWKLDRPIHLRVFARSDEFDRFRQRLDEYQYGRGR
jgi:hypothetical protein